MRVVLFRRRVGRRTTERGLGEPVQWQRPGRLGATRRQGEVPRVGRPAQRHGRRRPGWLQDLTKNEPARKAFKKNDWNHFRIECKGDSFKTWINGVPAADTRDAVDASGFIALQVHGAPKDSPKQEVRFRNLKIKE